MFGGVSPYFDIVVVTLYYFIVYFRKGRKPCIIRLFAVYRWTKSPLISGQNLRLSVDKISVGWTNSPLISEQILPLISVGFLRYKCRFSTVTYLVKKNTSPEKCRKTSPAFLPRLYWRIAAARRFRGQGASPECVALWEGVTMPRLPFCFTVKNRRSEGLSRWGMLYYAATKKAAWAALICFLCWVFPGAFLCP